MPAVASFAWTDALGSASLDNGRPGVTGRFQNWKPMPAIPGDEEEGLGTGMGFIFKYRDDYQASWQLELIPHASYPLAARLVRHLLNKGMVSVTTGDSVAHVYPTCQAVKGSPPTLEMVDRFLRDWTLTVTLRDVSAAPVELIALY